VLPALRRKVNAAVLQYLLAAIRGAKAARIKYQSLSRSTPTLRWITLHAIAFDGVRWHVRAYCAEHGDFRDFVLSRISLVNEMRDADASSEADKAWSGMVTLRLAPNPQLSIGARRGLELDYGMTKGVARIPTQVCFSYYIERQLGLDLDQDQVDPNR
jgi:predicted DNA-binding transcriptional regulator YafY